MISVSIRTKKLVVTSRCRTIQSQTIWQKWIRIFLCCGIALRITATITAVHLLEKTIWSAFITLEAHRKHVAVDRKRKRLNAHRHSVKIILISFDLVFSLLFTWNSWNFVMWIRRRRALTHTQHSCTVNVISNVVSRFSIVLNSVRSSLSSTTLLVVYGQYPLWSVYAFIEILLLLFVFCFVVLFTE